MMKVIASPKCREKSLRVSHKNRLTHTGSAWPLPSELEKGHREKSVWKLLPGRDDGA